jgi:hypothetical protein
VSYIVAGVVTAGGEVWWAACAAKAVRAQQVVQLVCNIFSFDVMAFHLRVCSLSAGV